MLHIPFITFRIGLYFLFNSLILKIITENILKKIVNPSLFLGKIFRNVKVCRNRWLFTYYILLYWYLASFIISQKTNRYKYLLRFSWANVSVEVEKHGQKIQSAKIELMRVNHRFDESDSFVSVTLVTCVRQSSCLRRPFVIGFLKLNRHWVVSNCVIILQLQGLYNFATVLEYTRWCVGEGLLWISMLIY